MEEIPTLPAFRVEVQNPEGIFNVIKVQGEKLQEPDEAWDTQLSSTKIGGELIDGEETSVSLLKGPEGIQVMLRTQMEISSSEQQGPDQGYFNQAQVEKLKEGLEQRGTRVTVRDLGQFNSLKVSLDNGVLLGVELGYRSREHKSARYSEAAQIDNMSKSIARMATGESETNFANEEVSLELFKDQGEGKEPSYFGLENLDPEGFRNIMRTYAKGYEKVMEALHETKGKPLPDKPIVLAP